MPGVHARPRQATNLGYHSSCAEPGIVGMARVAFTPYPDPTQFDPESPYYDAKSKPDEPRWLLVDVQVLRKGNRLSITPVEPQHWRVISELLGNPGR